MFQSVANIFADEKEHLCEMDANMGDGDLGLTMSKGYGELPGIIRENLLPDDLGRTLAKAGMKLTNVIPSTMGLLMSSGLMTGGKAVQGTGVFGPSELGKFLEGFAEGIHKRGKCELGERTIYDALYPAGQKAVAAAAEGGDLAAVITAALDGAKSGVEATKEMLPKYGKAAVFTAKAKGIEDQGAVAGELLIQGLFNYIV